MTIKIVGNGEFGKALYSLVVKKEVDVSFVAKDDNYEVLNDADVVILAIPTQAIRGVLTGLKLKKDVIIINGTKGIEKESNKLPFEIVRDVCGEVNYFSLLGPSFAKEIILEMPTMVNLGYEKEDDVIVDRVKNLFQTDYFKVKTVKGIEALELAAIFKNVYAIACGMAAGLGFGMNTRTMLILLAISEIEKLAMGLNFKVLPDAKAGMLGDLILTTSSEQSRNFTFGQKMISCSTKECIVEIGQTIEGLTTISSIPYFLEKVKIDLPLARFIQDLVISDGKDIRKRFLEFIKKI